MGVNKMAYIFINASNFEIVVQTVSNYSLCGTFLKIRKMKTAGSFSFYLSSVQSEW